MKNSARLRNNDPRLPVEAYIELHMPVERLWEIFTEVNDWPTWNPCFWRARTINGPLKPGSTLTWWFNPIRPYYLYKMPVRAKIVEYLPQKLITWEVAFLPGFHALHSYTFEAIDSDRCRFGSWEIAEGPIYSLLRRFWLAHFHYVCDSSLAGAWTLQSEHAPTMLRPHQRQKSL